MHTVDEFPVGDGRPGHGAVQDEIDHLGESFAAVETIVPFPDVARQMLGADPVVGAVEPGLHVGKQDVDDRRQVFRVLPLALDDRVVVIGVAKPAIAREVGVDPWFDSY